MAQLTEKEASELATALVRLRDMLEQGTDAGDAIQRLWRALERVERNSHD